MIGLSRIPKMKSLKNLIKHINEVTSSASSLEYDQKLELSIAIANLQKELAKQMSIKKNKYIRFQLVWFTRDGATERVNVQQMRFNENEWQYKANSGVWYNESEAVMASTYTYSYGL